MTAPVLPRVSFGVIVLNGEPFTRYCLRALYPFAHQIIVVEGASPGATQAATAHGHSRDGTLEVLRDFKAREDPEGKVILVSAEDEGHPTGLWPGEKDEQSQAYARRATGEYLWQVDIDEFYSPHAMRGVLGMLKDDPSITTVSFHQDAFWGGPGYRVDGWYLRLGAGTFHRLFKWGPGYRYVTHRPPTVHDEKGRDLRRIHWVRGRRLTQHGATLFHYALLLPQQVVQKSRYYARASWSQATWTERWCQEVFHELRHPFRVHIRYEYPSWLERFPGPHPPMAEAMLADLRAGKFDIDLRPIDDIERLLRSRRYRAVRAVLRPLTPLGKLIEWALIWRRRWRNWSHDPIGGVRHYWRRWRH